MKKGQSLFEVIVAIGVAALVLVGAMSLSTASVRNSNFAKNDSVATKFAQEGTEFLREQRDLNWDDFRNNYAANAYPGEECFGTTFTIGDCGLISGVYTRRVVFDCQFYDPSAPPPGTSAADCADPADVTNLIRLTVRVSWDDSQGTHSVKNDAAFSRWR